MHAAYFLIKLREMKLVAGLGNPGLEYKNTRHNVGFMFLDFFIKKLGVGGNWKKEKRFTGKLLETIVNSEKVIFLKPQTFMNLSGESILNIMNFYKIPKENLVIIFDDASMKFGKIRFREKGTAGGQNGIKNIIAHIGEDFKRVKIGIGQNENLDLSNWVLSKFKKEEIKLLNDDIFEEVKELLYEKFFYVINY